MEFMNKASSTTLSIMFDKLKRVLADCKLYFLLLIRLKKIIKAAFHMTSSLILTETLEKIVDETCSCMDCDRATVYVVDEIRNELWSKIAKGTNKTFRLFYFKFNLIYN